MKRNKLISFSKSISGDMNGSVERLSVKEDDNGAVIKTYQKASHSDNPVTKEYIVSAQILSELSDVFYKHHMRLWNNKKNFSKVFVCDKASTSYHFVFNDGEVSFSSQVYPGAYGEKLNKLDLILAQYLKVLEEKEVKIVISARRIEEIIDYLNTNPKVKCNPDPDYDYRIHELLISLGIDDDYVVNYEKLEGKDPRDMTLAEISTMFTFILRGERFCDGYIKELVENGSLLTLAKREAELMNKL